ncbi:hypothetical protein AUQ37_06200 [Candidatus Methanomethylophilus sp. 1R26]|uniref:hypothetical protein n=1 Tax=Candidatus Methanomethylophilus sp. 1R26 TaxID=1769296 RepID=UPI000735E956|nr:hypothetical protein [Candidatus Methanomethylophilus sp. 1R26]KUE74131.1 hypothetical protein AUQ37_06200 [Candidatus Methanomethylophilus sp. 1R26]
MSADFEEHDRIFQQMPYIFMVGVFAAASIFIAACAALDVGGTPWWMFYATAAITVFVAVFCRWLSVKIRVEDASSAPGSSGCTPCRCPTSST